MVQNIIEMARPVFSARAIDRVVDAIHRGSIAAGPLVKEFEQQFSKQFQYEHVAACANGTAALHAALFALGVKTGDSVVTTALSFVASASSIVHAGATPIFCDVDDSLNIDPQKLDRVLLHARADGGHVAAVIFVHLYGNPTNLLKVKAICDLHGVALVEDCAQAHGARLQNLQAGNVGDIAAFSFYATKNIAAGEGGAVVSSNAMLIERVRKFINHGRVSAYEHEFVGYNYRMTDLHAALALDQLEHFVTNSGLRKANAMRLHDGLASLPEIQFPRIEESADHAFHQFTIIIEPEFRDKLASHLLSDRIRSTVYYPIPIPNLKCFISRPEVHAGSYDIANLITRRCLSLPVHPALGSNEIEGIINSVRRYLPPNGGESR